MKKVDPVEVRDLETEERRRKQTFYLVPTHELNDFIEEQENERERRRNLNYNRERRYAKSDEEMQRDIYAMFTEPAA